MLVSVIIPYFNDRENIGRCVYSVLKQNYPKIEIIIIDDENSFISKKILNKFLKKNKKIRIFNTKKNRGVSFARNIGIEKSKGEFIAFLDSDDAWKKNKIKFQIDEIKKRKLDVCYTNYLALDSKKNIIYKVKPSKKLFYSDLLRECRICCSSVIIKRKILKKYKFLNLKTKEDYELWLRIAKNNYSFGGINNYLTFYRLRSNSLSSNHFNKIYNAFKIYYFFNNFNLINSFIFTVRLYFNAFIKKYI